MEELLKVTTDNERITLSARDLHEFLEIKTHFKDWFPRMKEYGFEEGVDFCSFLSESTGGRPATDYQITIDMAKEICMIQRSDKGKQARQYFLQLEKEWNTPEKVMARALLLANRNIESLTAANNSLKIENKAKDQQIAELKPKADYTDVILQNKSLVTITSIAKDYGMSGSALNDKLHRLGVQYKMSGQWFLYSKYQDKGYTHSQTQTIVHNDGTTSVKMNTKWTQKGRLFLYELLKRNDLIPMIER